MAVSANRNSKPFHSKSMLTRYQVISSPLLFPYFVLLNMIYGVRQHSNGNSKSWVNILFPHICRYSVPLCTFSYCRCKLINVRRVICDWSHYEQDMQDLRGILESQFLNSSQYITGGQLLCHTPGNLLHFPLPLRIVSERM